MRVSFVKWGVRRNPLVCKCYLFMGNLVATPCGKKVIEANQRIAALKNEYNGKSAWVSVKCAVAIMKMMGGYPLYPPRRYK